MKRKRLKRIKTIKEMSKVFPEVSAEPQQCSFVSEGDKCNAENKQSQCCHPACILSRMSHLCNPLRMFHQAQSVEASALQLCNKQEVPEYSHNSVILFSCPFSITDLPHKSACVSVRQTQASSSAGCILYSGDKKGSS